MKKLVCLIIYIPICCVAQNVNFETLNVSFFRYPLKPLNSSVKTYSPSIMQMDGNLSNDQLDTLRKGAILIPGYTRVSSAGDVQVELVINQMTVTNKEIKDQLIESDQNGKKTVMHQYWYELKYAFPIKIKMMNQGEILNEEDLPGLFTTEYYSRDRTSQSSLQSEFDQDTNFQRELFYRKLDEAKVQIRKWLFSNYGFGMVMESISIGYVKDKKGEYADLTKAMSLLVHAFQASNNNKAYLNDLFKESVNEAIDIYNKALLESSDDKKARIDEKVTAVIQYNIALANYGMQNWDEAESWANKVRRGNNVTIGLARNLQDHILDKRQRVNANKSGAIISREESKLLLNKSEPKLQTISLHDYIVRTPGDTLNVRFIMPSHNIMAYGDSVWLQDKIIASIDDKKQEFLPQQLHSYSFNGVVRESVNWVKDFKTIPYTIEYKFCRRQAMGLISVYECYQVVPSTRNPEVNIVTASQWYRKGDVFESIGFLSFSKGMSRLVKDYPELSEKVKNGIYERKDLLRVVDEYNHKMSHK
jgi:hypothetical protein